MKYYFCRVFHIYIPVRHPTWIVGSDVGGVPRLLRVRYIYVGSHCGCRWIWTESTYVSMNSRKILKIRVTFSVWYQAALEIGFVRFLGIGSDWRGVPQEEPVCSKAPRHRPLRAWQHQPAKFRAILRCQLRSIDTGNANSRSVLLVQYNIVRLGYVFNHYLLWYSPSKCVGIIPVYLW